MARKATTTKDPNLEPPKWALILIVATIAFVVVIFNLPSPWLESLPFGTSDYFYVGLIVLPIIVMLAAIVGHKLYESRRAATWVEGQGRITRSEVIARAHKFAGETSEIRNFPDIDYSFKVEGVTYKGSRISIGNDTAGANTEATLKRYPKGAAVTVYYDPANPKNCVLERDFPKDFSKGCLMIIGFAVAACAAVYWIITSGGSALEGLVEPGQEGVVLFAGLFGVTLLLGFIGVRSNAKGADAWPVANGEVISSTVEKYEQRNNRRTTVYYAPLVEYVYKVNGLEYHSKQIRLAITTSGSQSAAEKTAARYPQGAKVEVHYDPANPENAALENTGNTSYILLAAAAFCFVVAVYASGIFKS